MIINNVKYNYMWIFKNLHLDKEAYIREVCTKQNGLEVNIYSETSNSIIYLDVRHNPPTSLDNIHYFSIECINCLDSISSEELKYLELVESQSARDSVEFLAKLWNEWNER